MEGKQVEISSYHMVYENRALWVSKVLELEKERREAVEEPAKQQKCICR